MKQILLNLLSNAIKFTEPGGSVALAARRDACGGVAVGVRDTGVGMTADEIKTALEPFGQVDARLARAHEGTGFGLPLARRLTELHGGTLTVESVKGTGTIVTVTLPKRLVQDNQPTLAETELTSAGTECETAVSAEPAVLHRDQLPIRDTDLAAHA